ncbi:molybdopterin molybdochelatase [Scopulibacillus darangshiensis]|uniref:Molybdopterin molybdenumtransferase n=1 Tax=Scopulibacillus darangshiensis TaxID=442528 RepID=A0A4R2P7G6_9BACL|nr:gephyrin-like molybdotransferase Glp [Scopulibacillus darangshiensis]TCP29765.1 molybdopterin molybdochelatase [Scopulibacillus darangshiensis]
MVERRKSIPVEEAVQRVLTNAKALEGEEIRIEESDGRYLAEDIVADHDVPPFNRSPYDGFAIVAGDTAAASRDNPALFEVIETIGAGDVAEKEVTNGSAIRIMTGAALPKGADAVVMLELTSEIDGSEGRQIAIKRPFKSGDNISWQGEDTASGSILLKKGRKITPGVKAVLATFGYAHVKVYKRPVVGVIATGSELLEVHEPLEPGKIRNSNAHMILAQIRQTGAIPVYLDQLKDDFDQSFERVSLALDAIDVLITTGGVSVGDFDYLPAIYEKLGAEVLFNKVGMRPGSVTTVAKLKDQQKWLFGLSGNPSACFVGFELFAGPYLKTMQGVTNRFLQSEEAVLSVDFPKSNPFTRFVRCRVKREGGHLYAAPVGLDKSNVVTSLADSNALMILPGGTRGYKSGESIKVLLLQGEGSDKFCL